MQDVVYSDLRRFMFDDMPDNVAELRAELKERQIIGDIAKVQDGEVVAERPLFSEAVNKELAKRRPDNMRKKRGIATFGLAFSGLAVFSLVMLPEPLNWAMAVGCLIPFVVPMLKYKLAKRRARRL